MEYFLGTPQSGDQMWRTEIQSVWSWLTKKERVLDPGAGGRTLTPETVCGDLTQGQNAMQLAYPDNEFDAVFTAHLLEHLRDPVAALREWLRVVKPGGVVACVVPATEHTRGQNTDATPHLWEWTERRFLMDVLRATLRSDQPWCEVVVPQELYLRHALPERDPDGRTVTLVQFGVAAPHWSFQFVLSKPA